MRFSYLIPLGLLVACSGSRSPEQENVAQPISESKSNAPPENGEEARPERARLRPGAPEPSAASVVAELGADFLGTPIEPRTPQPGRYALVASFRQHRFITMERTTSSGIDGKAVLSVRGEGSVYACFLIESQDRSSSSKYANRDGVARSSENKGGRLVGARGKWTDVEGTMRIELDRFNYESCAVEPDAQAHPEPTRLDCLGFGPTKRIKGAWLGCRVEDERAPMAELGMFVADSPRAGAWAHRRDPSGRGEPLPETGAHPWLLLGTPALEIDADDTDRSDTRIELSISDRKLDESKWKPPVYESKRTGEPKSLPPPD